MLHFLQMYGRDVISILFYLFYSILFYSIEYSYCFRCLENPPAFYTVLAAAHGILHESS